MLTQGTLISYHTEAFVKTEVGCTVVKRDALEKIKVETTYKENNLANVLNF